MNEFPFVIQPQDDHERFILEALREAWKAYQVDEVPIGAVLVHENRVIARGYNQVEMLKDATAHAEMLCLTAGAAALDNWRLADCILYCTVEPCAMCAGAIMLSRVPTIYWGAPDVRHGANGSWIDLFDRSHPTHAAAITGGVLREPCAALMRDFFKEKRKEKSTRVEVDFDV